MNETLGYQKFINKLVNSSILTPLFELIAKMYYKNDMTQLRAMFIWAISIVDSRSFRSKLNPNSKTDNETQYLMPYFDLLNHAEDNDSNVYTSILSSPKNNKNRVEIVKYFSILKSVGFEPTYLMDDFGGFKFEPFQILFSSRDIKKGEELVTSYSLNWDITSSDEFEYDMLFGFGFLPKLKQAEKVLTSKQKIENLLYNLSLKTKSKKLKSIDPIIDKSNSVLNAAKLGMNINFKRNSKK